MSFPAKQISTEKKSLKDLSLGTKVLEQEHRIVDWVRANEGKDGAQTNNSKGFRALFIGPPKSGKKATAAFIAKETGRDIYRIDLSELISKYIGETEKNLEVLFTRAEEKKWILYFDEADALFGKRDDKDDKDDKYSNVEISSLLHSIQHYPGLVILTTKKKKKIDEALLSRFNAILDFTSDNKEGEDKKN